MQAIRGAIQIDRNEREVIANAVKQLCAEIEKRNRLEPADIVSAIFTLTPDLDADFPARAAREVGWGAVPLLCAQEVPVPGALPRVCRVLLHVRGKKPGKHVYLGGAEKLRPDLAKTGSADEASPRAKKAAPAKAKRPAKAKTPAKKPARAPAKKAKRAR